MPVYNGERYIREALDSLLAQTHAAFELIISDNASTDGTEAICQAYALSDPRVRYFRQTKNLGASANFRIVLGEAKSKYFMWAASDDAWDPGWISEMLEAITKTQSQAAFGTIQCIDENSDEFNHYANGSTFDYRSSALVRRLKYFLEFEGAGKANPIYGLWETNKLRPINFDHYTFDYLIVFDLLKTAKIAGSRKAKLFKRHHQQSEGIDTSKSSSRGAPSGARNLLGYLMKPFPANLIDHYYRSAGESRWLFVALTPIKYLFAYWFYIARKLRARRYT